MSEEGTRNPRLTRPTHSVKKRKKNQDDVSMWGGLFISQLQFYFTNQEKKGRLSILILFYVFQGFFPFKVAFQIMSKGKYRFDV